MKTKSRGRGEPAIVTFLPAGKQLLKAVMGRRSWLVRDARGWRSLRGLMFDSRSEGALISGSSVWMLFVKHPLRLYFLDEQMQVLKKQQAVPLTFGLKTWRIYSCPGASMVLEVRKA